MFLAVHNVVELVAAPDNVELVYDAVEAEVVAAHDVVELVAAHDAKKAVVSPSLYLHIFSLYFSAKYYGFTKLI